MPKIFEIAVASALTLAAFGLIVSASAQAPPKGTSYAACKADSRWRWIGTIQKGRCFRKLGAYIQDKTKKQ